MSELLEFAQFQRERDQSVVTEIERVEFHPTQLVGDLLEEVSTVEGARVVCACVSEKVVH